MVEIPRADWVVATMTLVYCQLLVMKKWQGWLLGIITQFLWIYVTIQKEIYGLTALSCVFVLQFSYGWRVWLKAGPKSRNG